MAEPAGRNHLHEQQTQPCASKDNVSAAMQPQNRTERAREHLQEGERLVVALREMIDDQNAVGASTEMTERLLRSTLSTLDRLRTSLC